MCHEQALPAALEAFERSLETPIIPGELPTWTENARQTCSEAVATLKEHVPTWHKRVMEDIKRQDPELLNRVEQLRGEDADLLHQARGVRAAAEKLAADAKALASHEPTVKHDVESLIDAGLEWIIQARKQEAALTAWYQEAFNRDRGIAD